MLSLEQIKHRQEKARENKVKSYQKHVANSEFYKKRELLSLFDRAYNVAENTIKINRHNSKIHEYAKSLLAVDQIFNDDTIYSEIIYTTGDRGDLASLKLFSGIELISSESKASIEAKKLRYPLPVMSFDARKVVIDCLTKVINELKVSQ